MIRAAPVLAVVLVTMRCYVADAAQQPSMCDDQPQRAQLTHRVIDKMTRVPLRGALLTVTWSDTEAIRVTTDSTGRARICAPADKPITSRVSYHTIRPSAQSFTLKSDRPSEHTFALEVPSVLVRGSVTDQTTGEAISNVGVRLANTPLATVTSADGKFSFAHVPIGDYIIRTDHISYAVAILPLSVRAHDLDAAIRLLPAAVALEPIVVTSFSVRLEQVGFYERKKRGTGTFLDRKQIDAMNTQRSSDLLRNVPSMRLVPQVTRRNAPHNTTTGRGNCRFKFIVDGSRTLPDFEMDMVAPYAIEGVEVYKGLSEVPAQFRAISETGAGTCGVIAIWTRDRR